MKINVFDDEEKAYYLRMIFSHKPGYEFDSHPTVYYNGDASIFDSGLIFGDDYVAFTISYHVTDPTASIAEQTAENITLWPNPVVNVLYLDVMDGTSVSIFDMTGRMVKQERYEGKVDVSDLVPGLYAIKAEGVMVRFVKE